MMKFSAIYQPTSLFSLKDSNSTNSAAKSLFLPSPYAIKMAILNQAIICGGDLEKLESKNSKEFGFIRDCKIGYYLEEGSNFCATNSFVKILKPKRNGEGFMQTVTFREYVYLSHPLEITFEVESKIEKLYLQRYLHRINYFGKRGCFFQFLKYSDHPNNTNVKSLEINNFTEGILQKFDDFSPNAIFENVSNFSNKSSKRVSNIKIIPVGRISSSKAYTHYQLLNS